MLKQKTFMQKSKSVFFTALLTLFILCMTLGSVGLFDRTGKALAEDTPGGEAALADVSTDTLKQMGFIQNESEKPSDYRTDPNPLNYEYSNLHKVPELNVYSAALDGIKVKTVRQQFDNKGVINKTKVTESAAAEITVNASANVPVKAVALNVERNVTLNQKFTAELSATSATTWTVSFREGNSANVQAFQYSFGVSDWSFMKDKNNRDSNHLFDHYFQIVSGDFNGDGCDDIAFYEPDFKQTGKTRTAKISIIFLKWNKVNISQLSYKQIIMPETGGFTEGKDIVRTTPTINLTAANLNKDKYSDLAITRGWVGTWYSPGNNDPASTLYIYDKLTDATLSPSFTMKLEHTGNLMAPYADIGFFFQNMETAKSTALIGATTATGNITVQNDDSSNTGDELVIGGFLTHRAGDKYADFSMNGILRTSGIESYIPVISYVQYDYAAKKYFFGTEMPGGKSDKFIYQPITTAHGVFFDQQTSLTWEKDLPPVSIATAKLLGNEYNASVIINGVMADCNINEVGKRVFYSNNYDISFLLMYHKKTSGNNWVSQTVAANVSGTENGREQVYTVWNNGGGAFVNEFGIFKTVFNTLAFEQFSKSYPVRDFYYNSYTSLCLQDIDANDGLTAKFKERTFTYTKPRVLGVLAAAPYFSELAATDNGYLSGGGVSFSAAIGEAGEGRVSGSAYAGAGVKVEAGIIPGVSAKFELEVIASASYQFSYGWEVVQTVTYTNTTPYDQVIATVLPVDLVYYDVIRYDEQGREKSKDTMCIEAPYSQLSVMLPVSEFDAIAAGTDGLVPIGGNILKSTAGDPASYTNFAPPVAGDEIKHVEWDSGWGISKTKQSAWTSSTLEIEVSDTFSHALDFEITVQAKAEIGVIVGGTATVGGSVGGGYTFVDFQKSIFSGTVSNLNKTSESPARYHFDWQLCDFNVELENGDKFPVVTFQTSDIRRPVLPPKNFKANGISTTQNKLTWDHPVNPGIVTAYEIQYRKRPNTNWATPQTVSSSDSSYTHGGLSAGDVYEYRIRAITGSNVNTHSVYTPVIFSYTKVASPPVFSKNVVNVSGSIGDPAEFSVTVVSGRPGSQIDYQWQTYNKLTSEWKNISNATSSSYSTLPVTTSDIGKQFRCVVTETLNDIPAEIISNTGEIDVPKIATTTGLTLRIPSGRALHDSVTLTATAADGVTPVTGMITFTITGPDYQKAVYVNIDITSGTAVYAFTAPYEGVFTIKAAYSGDAKYRASVSALQTYTASAVVCVNLEIASVSSRGDVTFNGEPQAGYQGTPYFYEIGKPPVSGVEYEVWYESADENYYSSSKAPISVGDYRVIIRPSNTVLYSGELVLNFTIKPRLIFIEPHVGQSKKYGDPDPVFTYTAEFGYDPDLNNEALIDSVVFEGALERSRVYSNGESGAGSLGENAGKYFISMANISAGSNYEIYFIPVIEFEIKKADYNGISSPAASAVYNKQLMLFDVDLPMGYTWTGQNKALTVADSGTVFSAKYNAVPSNYNDFLLNITVIVEKAADGFLGQSLEVTKTYSPGLTLDSIKLDSDFVWISPWTALFAGDGQSFAAIYTDPSGNYLPDKITVTVNVAKAAGSFGAVAAISAVYSDSLLLGDLPLPSGYEWEDPGIWLTAGNNLFYRAVYTDPSGNYSQVIGTVTVHLAKAQNDGTIASPTIASKTSNSITINAVAAPLGKAIEYSISPSFASAATVWQTGLTFNGLESGTAYCVFARIQSDANYLAGAAVFTLISTMEKTYVITEGGNSTWNGDTAKDLQIVCNGDYSRFVGVKVNGALVDKENYAVNSDSSAVTLHSEYLQTLSSGKNTVEIVFTNGSVSTTMTVGNGTGSPDDNAGGTPGWAIAIIILCCVIILAMSGFAVYLFIIRKEKYPKPATK